MNRVYEIFSDFSGGSSIGDALIENVTLMKKTNSLVIRIISSKYIAIREIEAFNNFIKKRFILSDSKTAIKYTDEVDRKHIENEIKNVILLISDRHPLLKAAVNDCDYDINENEISLKFKVVVSHIFKKLNYDKELQEAIKNFCGRSYRINFSDDVSHEALMKIKEKEEKKELLAIQKQIKSQQAAINKAPKPVSESEVKEEGKKENTLLIYGRNANIKDQVVKIVDITQDEGNIVLEGEISNIETRELRSGKVLISFDLYDGSGSITFKSFVKGEQFETVEAKIKKAKGVTLRGNAGYSKFSGEVEVIANTIIESGGLMKITRKDKSDVKRVELHMHTKMSQMDGMTGAADLIKRAMIWGMKSIAITDHGVVQSFPDAHKLLGRDNPNMKVIYGVEAYLAPDRNPSVVNSKGQSIDTTYCVLDLETTGF